MAKRRQKRHGHVHDHGHDHAHDHDHDDEVVGEDAEERAEHEREARSAIARSQVRQYGDPALRMRAETVESFDDGLRFLTERMTALMHEAEGIGLAATQLGIIRRVFVCSLDDQDMAIVNPVLVKHGTETETGEEGCLSLADVRVSVERPTTVTLEAQGLDGEPIRLELEGLSARVVQHELDHLDGKLIIDRTDPESRREALRQLRPRLALRA